MLAVGNSERTCGGAVDVEVAVNSESDVSVVSGGGEEAGTAVNVITYFKYISIYRKSGIIEGGIGGEWEQGIRMLSSLP